MQQLHSSKNFYFKKGEKTKVINELALEMGIKPSTLQKHLSILQSKNIVFFKHNCIKLASNKEINQWNATIKFVTIPESITTLKQIKIFLVGIPLLSNLYKQKRQISKKNTRLIKKREAESNKFIPGMSSRQRRHDATRDITEKSVNRSIILTNESICKKLGKKSNTTATKYKHELKKLGCYKVLNKIEVLKENVNYFEFLNFKEHGGIEKATYFFNNGKVVKFLPSEFFLPFYLSPRTNSPKVKHKKIEKTN